MVLTLLKKESACGGCLWVGVWGVWVSKHCLNSRQRRRPVRRTRFEAASSRSGHHKQASTAAASSSTRCTPLCWVCSSSHTWARGGGVAVGWLGYPCAQPAEQEGFFHGAAPLSWLACWAALSRRPASGPHLPKKCGGWDGK